MKKKYYSFKYKLSITFFLVQMVIIIFVGIIHYLNIRNILYDDYNKNQTLLEDKITSSVRATDACYFIVENNLLPQIRTLTDKILDDYNKTNELQNINLQKYINDNNTTTISIIDINNGVINSTDNNEMGRDYSKNLSKDIFFEDVRSKKIFMNDRIYMSSDGKNIIKPTYESTSDGKYIVMVATDMKKYCDTIKLAFQDFNNIYDSLKSLDKNIQHVEIFTEDATAFGSKTSSENLNLLYKENETYLKKALKGNETINLYRSEHNKAKLYKFIPYKLMNSSSDLNTNVIYIEYDNSLLDSKLRNNLFITLVSAAGAFLLAAIFGIFASKYLTEPIEKIFIGIKNISKGNFNYKLEVATNDEFGMLCCRFNEMIVDLENLNEEREIQSKEILSQKDEINALYQQTNAMNKELFNLLDQQKISYLSTVKALANAIEAKDKYTEGHCKRVTQYCLAIAKEMKLTEEEITNIHFASLLHDIGKIGIPSSIINKKGKLTDEEFNTIKKHPMIGYEILKNVEFLKESNEIILQHHERMDGRGYPNSLCSKSITLLGKILSVADSYDAMTSSRPYRTVPFSISEALLELERNTGTQFDCEVVEIFIKIMMEE